MIHSTGVRSQMYLPLQSVIGVTLADIRVYKSSLTTCVEAHSKKSPIQSAVSLGQRGNYSETIYRRSSNCNIFNHR